MAHSSKPRKKRDPTARQRLVRDLKKSRQEHQRKLSGIVRDLKSLGAIKRKKK